MDRDKGASTFVIFFTKMNYIGRVEDTYQESLIEYVRKTGITVPLKTCGNDNSGIAPNQGSERLLHPTEITCLLTPRQIPYRKSCPVVWDCRQCHPPARRRWFLWLCRARLV